jgi:hypothetical protein
MRISIFVVLFICLANWSIAQTVMHPFASCPEFEVQYEKVTEKNQEFFRVSFTEASKEIKTYDVESIRSLIEKKVQGTSKKELSLLDHLKRRAREICPEEKKENEIYCPEKSPVIGEEFEIFLTKITEKISEDGHEVCKQIPDFAILKSEVEGLDSQTILNYKKSHHWAKLFQNIGQKKYIKEKYQKLYQKKLGEKWKTEWHKFWQEFKKDKLNEEKAINQNVTSSLIDAWVACGGKKNDGLFIKNLIKINAIESCLSPKPPGVISTDELEELSSEIAEKTKKKSLVNTLLSKESIILEATKELAKRSIRNSVSNMFGEMIEPDPKLRDSKVQDFVDNLVVMKNLSMIRPGSEMAKVFPDYASYVFGPNAKMEVAEKMIPIIVDYLVANYVKNELPKDKVEGLKSKIKGNFDDCKKMNSNFSKIYESEDKQLYARMWHYKEFCSKPENSSKCQSSCDGPSYLENSPIKKDEDVVKECMIYSFGASLGHMKLKFDFREKNVEILFKK